MRASEKHPSVDGEDVTQTTHGSPPPRLSPKGAGENSLGTGPQSLPECGWGRRFVAPSEAEFAPIWRRRNADPSHTISSSGSYCAPVPKVLNLTRKVMLL